MHYPYAQIHPLNFATYQGRKIKTFGNTIHLFSKSYTKFVHDLFIAASVSASVLESSTL